MENRNADKYLKWKSNKKFKKKFIKKSKLETELKSGASAESKDFKLGKCDDFEKFPISTKTKAGLRKHNYIKPTSIQRAAIPSALQGKDILGAAKTGSGKTLAFLIPVVECLFENQWNSFDGPGALIISPTRELAYQIFDVLRKIGCKHTFSAGLTIGGTKLKEEREQLCRTNIIVSTPGRLLQHLNETSYFNFDNLKMLVLDEADRILDMGFQTTINAILENLPNTRQTLLFSATQTRSVKDLARLSMQDPVLVSVHAESLHSTPMGLQQRYVVCDLSEKLNVLYSFIRSHLKSKTIVFLSSCKQVLYVYSLLCRIRPGVPLLHLHGRMNQQRRMLTYQEFCRKQFVVLVATDLAARGLDFPNVNWVLQYDCPEDAETYIHRAGRTARFHEDGNALLLLLPSEKEGMLQELKKRKVPISSSEVNTEKLVQTKPWFQSYCAQDKELKERAQRCFVSYVRAVHLMKNKQIFSVQSLPLEAFADSLGLAFPPRLRFLQKKFKDGKMGNRLPVDTNKVKEDVATSLSQFGNSDDEHTDDLFVAKADLLTTSDQEDDSLAVDDLSEIPVEEIQSSSSRNKSKAASAKRLLKKGLKVNQKIKFDEAGDVLEAWPPLEASQMETSGGIDIEKAKDEMKVRDQHDRAKQQAKIKERHKEARLKAKALRRQVQKSKQDVGEECQLGSPTSSGNDESENERNDSNSQHSSVGDSDSENDNVEFDASHSKEKQLQPLSKRRKMENTEMPDVTLTLQEKEDLALHLLHS